MSWSGFKKNVGRATTQVMMKTGHVEKTSDREYEVEERRYRTLEAASLRLQKEAKGYLDSLRAMTASQMRIAETIDAFYGDSGAKDGVSRSYKQAVEDLDAETVKALDGPYRCVPDSLRELTDDDTVIKEIEEEMNFMAGKRRVYTRGNATAKAAQEYGLMEYMYRTTVLEPINRFCAYFPDINECIKKRQHKMLDYDSMRSKVKKLTEKPDKDPGKLPRTEKEAEMVSQHDSPHSPYTNTTQPDGPYDPEEMLDLTVPSPPKALARPEIQKLRLSERMPYRSVSMSGSPSTSGFGTGSSWSTAMPSTNSGSPLRKTPSTAAGSTLNRSSSPAASINGSSSKNRDSSGVSSRKTALRATSGPVPVKSESCIISQHEAGARSGHVLPTPRKSTEPNPAAPAFGPAPFVTPFFQPSELEEIMEPFRLEFLKKQADELEQAKAAYEQLNEQLTNELPQLIDLRVPYLDPTFEALVKIQLRFCAEAYSRMAQVQQYLDASTRDQYASGDLDARVEDVLGQIRELSIAGTV